MVAIFEAGGFARCRRGRPLKVRKGDRIVALVN